MQILSFNSEAYRGIQPQTSSGQNDSQSDVPQRRRPPVVNVHPFCYNWDVSQQETHQQHTCNTAESVREERRSFRTVPRTDREQGIKTTCYFLNLQCSCWTPETLRITVGLGSLSQAPITGCKLRGVLYCNLPFIYFILFYLFDSN